MTDRRRKLARERQRRLREGNRLPWRRRIVLLTEVEEHAFAEALMDAGRLSPAQSEDRKALAGEAAEILKQWQKTVTRDAADPPGWGMLKATKSRTEADES